MKTTAAERPRLSSRIPTRRLLRAWVARSAVAAAAVGALACATPAEAQQLYYWDGSTNSDWTNFFNWTPFGGGAGGVPSSSDSVIFDSTALSTGVDLGSGTQSVLNAASSGNKSYLLTNGHLNVFGEMFVDTNGGAFTFLDASSSLHVVNRLQIGSNASNARMATNGGSLYVGDAANTGAANSIIVSGLNSTSNLHELGITNSAIMLHSGNAIIGNRSGESGDVTISNNALLSLTSTASSLYVGYEGSGDFTLSGGGKAGNHNGYIGRLAGSGGSASVKGAGSTWTNNGFLIVGDIGSGVLRIDNGGRVSNTIGYIGYSGSGSVDMEDAGSVWNNSVDLILGNASTQTNTLRMVTGARVFVGDAAEASAASLSADRTLIISDADNNTGNGVGGNLNILNNSQVVNGGSAVLGSQTGQYGYAKVNGADSYWENIQDVILGNAGGRGTLELSAGGRLFIGDKAKSAGQANSAPTLIVSDADNTNGNATGGGRLLVQNNSSFTNNGLAILGAYVGEHGHATVTGTGASWTNYGNLFVGDLGNGTLTIASGGFLSDAIGYIGQGVSSDSSATVTGTSSRWTSSSGLYVADFGKATLTIADAGKVDTNTSFIGDETGSDGTVLVDNATFDNTVSLFLGNKGKGTLTAQNAGKVMSVNSFLAYQAGSTGTATIDGAGSIWTNTGDLFLGGSATADGGSATLTTTNGGAVHVGDAASSGFAGYLTVSDSTNTDGTGVGGNLLIRNAAKLTHASGTTIGHLAGQYGYAKATGAGSEWTQSGNLFVGYKGHGTLAVESGASVSNLIGYIGQGTGSDSSATVTGTNSIWNNSSGLYVADFGKGMLTISSNGRVNSTASYIGDETGSDGTVVVDNASFDSTDGLYVGNKGKGTLNIKNGGAVSGYGGFIAFGPNSTGSATVTGNGSTWTTVSSLTIGEEGAATLAIEAGGAVSNLDGYIGFESDSTGVVTVKGTGSTWTNSSNFHVGHSGTGTLTIENGGVVSNTDGVLGVLSGSTGMATVTGPGSTWTNSGGLYIGGSATNAGGNGTLNVQTGGTVNTDGPSKIWSNGTLNIAGGTYNAKGGFDNDGTLIHTDGILAISGGPVQGLPGLIDSASGNPTVQIGVGSTWNNTGDLYVGNVGTGTLNINTGGTVYVGDAAENSASSSFTVSDSTNTDGTGIGGHLYVLNGSTLTHANVVIIGDDDDEYGYVTVSGLGSTANTGTLFLGFFGTGALTIEAGGKVTSSGALMGFAPNSTSTATVTGPGSTWTNTQELFVGYNVTGTLTIENGGVVSNTDGVLGVFFGSTGTATIDGAGSIWTNTGDLTVGGNGTGTLKIENGGGVYVAGDLIMQGSGGTAYLNFDIYALADPFVDVVGDATLAGTLSVDVDAGFTLTHDDTFTLVDIGGTKSGAFSNAGEDAVLGLFSNVGLLLTYAGGDGNDVVAYAVQAGDADQNDKVEFTDFVILSNNYSGPTTGQTWANGDFNGDGDVAFADFVLLSNNWGFDTNAPAPAQADAASAVNAGEAKLIVGADGSLSIEGGNVDLNGYSITSASGQLIADGDNNANPFTFYIANSATDITAGNLGTFVNVDGLLELDAAVNLADLSNLDLIFEYGTAAGSVTGTVEVVPEPTSLALLGMGGVLLMRRRGA